jgi:hypothetical protein
LDISQLPGGVEVFILDVQRIKPCDDPSNDVFKIDKIWNNQVFASG